ncbi:SH3 domain-containing protein [Salipiger sp. P9]|uniref:SH3 domain-containing protein n=1 Tax=Salipiger pentaromativorans TaxID=2943193 RepID=UPI002158584C|nr:SH3 domain-containing protein [Salipiger pentaromativorans]MCR8547202.1 SH3 domain-containing protein [Salipiger pentaromativorans]
MRGFVFKALALGFLAAAIQPDPAAAGWRDRYEVYGVEEGDMLKMRGGPGIGFDVYVGLPNGTVVRLIECTQTGGTRWCKVSLDRARSLKGWVSWAYLREI